ncbi:adenylate cyclase-associated protein [Chloropicon primus]|uniref:Adenylyl cyclase-associated protein n=1 Tax=Chloropicon primus TaxID=1764295 RepID=A0A5B8MW08_9CHLO|nr:adenylate cyclase-associated protein [Chloropicon primus]|mmetsp:Transcript_449/g.1269  ORF Transcript_449/g.1269 Transcript_449/m.1269 type:complete len:496 (+) Transcript_449:85-1572(+)|eukprot:QDZ24617.1 adenylate cyclase-associated protein [Chloropicon primus]
MGLFTRSTKANNMEASMESLVKRLESVCARLEGVGGAPQGVGVAAAPQQGTSGGSGGGAAGGASVEGFQALIDTKVNKLVSTASAIGEADLVKTTGFLKTAFDEEAKIIACVSSCKKPDMQTLQSLLKPTADQIGACYDFAGDRKNKAFQHTKVMSECMQGLTWVAYMEGSGMSMPMKTVQESWNSAEFFANKLLMQYRGKDKKQVEWITTLKELMTDLASYVKEHHATGPAWNPRGGDAKSFDLGGAKPPSSSSGGAPAAPPPPPAGSLTQAKPASGSGAGGNKAALFSELNKGADVTAGLKKVTADMKAKNRTDKSGLVKAAPKPKKKETGPKIGKTQFAGGKWFVEGHVQNKEIVIEETKSNQGVLITGNTDCVVQIKGKVNTIIVDNCKKVGVIFQDVISTVETVNCKSIQLQPLGKIPSIAIDKTDGCQLYLGKDSLDTEVVTAKSSELNIIVPQGEDDFKEIALPEQFVSKYDSATNSFVTAPAEHGAG